MRQLRKNLKMERTSEKIQKNGLTTQLDYANLYMRLDETNSQRSLYSIIIYEA